MEKYVDIGIPNFDFFSLVQQAGFPIALAVVCGWFIMQAIQLVLSSVVKSIKKIIGLIKSMDGRVKQMNIDVLDLDKLVSKSLEVDPLPLKVHHEVAAVMNSHGEKPPPLPSPPPPPDAPKKSSILKKISDVVDDAVGKAQDIVDDATKLAEKVEKIKK
jgi:hypothetical protein